MNTTFLTPAAIILDRDGVINIDSPQYIKSCEEWHPILGSISAIAMLSKQLPVAIATNQSGISRGLFHAATLTTIHEKLTTCVTDAGGSIHTIRYCPHGNSDDCSCRKPKPGMLLDICNELNITPEQAWFIGDSLSDLQAAVAARCQPVLVLTGNGYTTYDNNHAFLRQHNVNVYTDLAAIALKIIHDSSFNNGIDA